MRKQIFSFLLFLFATATVFGQGKIRGTISDENSGEFLMFCNVSIKDSDPIIGGQTDMDGTYEIEIGAGVHAIEVSYVGYPNKIITDIEVKDGEVTVMDILMNGDAVALDLDVVVTAKAIERNEIALLNLQRKSTTIQDGISSQEISRFGASNAASAMKRVTGASVVDGKYIFVRGLGDRYSSAMLNGIPLPSTDPYRNSVSLDLVPANLLDNLIASKTFSPNQPGNFTGGNVNMKTKSFPERFTLSANISTSFNENSSFNDNFLTYEGGDYDGLGYDDGSRDMPEYLKDEEIRSQLVGSLNSSAKRNDEKAAILDKAAKSLNSEMAPTTMSSPMNYGASFSIGNQFDVGEDAIGVLVGLNYKKSYSHYENGTFANWELTDRTGDQLTNNRNLRDTRSVESPTLGGMASINYKFAGSQKIGLNVLYNHDAQKEARSLNGTFPAILSGGGFESRSILFKERELASYQLTGEHLLTKGGIKLEWGGGFIQTSQSEPDLRLFANSFIENQTDGTTDYFISASEFDLPYHFFRDLQDEQTVGKIDLTIPFMQGKSKANKIQVGGFYQKKDREFTEDRFQYQVKSRDAEDYAGDPTTFFAEDNLGIIGRDTARNQNISGLFVTDETILANSYTGTEEITAAYGMVTYDFGKLKFVGGARMEITDMDVQSADTTKTAGAIDKTDVLPSLNLIYALSEKTNLRASYTHTLARPNMREMAPFSSFEFIGDFIFTGNPDLERTLVKNYDLRWEFFPTAGELVAFSAYYKDFKNPISIAFVPEAANPEIRYENLTEATVYGIEAEFRKNLGFITPALSDFKIFSNVSFIHSEAPVPQTEKEIIETINPDKGTTRPFIGQSPFLFNAGLNYSNKDIGLDATIAVNSFGDRLKSLRFGEQPDIYEQSRAALDFTIKKSLSDRMNIKVSIMNILDAAYKTQMEFKGNEFIVTDFRRGRTYGVSLSYNI